MSPWLSELFLGAQSDERLVSLARAGQERAFVMIVQRYQRQLLAFARRLDSSGRAEDIVQQSFLSAFAALQSGAEVQHLRGWLHQIVRNAAAKTANGASGVEPRDPLPQLAVTTPLEEQVERRMLATNALAEISRLPERQRDALVATALNGRSRSEVAHAMGVSEGAVRQLLHRARASMRTAVTAITPYPIAQWLASPRGGSNVDRIAEASLGGGAAAGGAALKLGAVVVSGVVATGIVVARPGHHSHHPSAAHHRVAAATRIELASTTAAGSARGGARAASTRQPASRAGLTAATRSTGRRPRVSTAFSGPRRSDGGSRTGSGDGRDGSALSGHDTSSGGDHGGRAGGGQTSGGGGRDGQDSGGTTTSSGPTSTLTTSSSDGGHGSDGGDGGSHDGSGSAPLSSTLVSSGGS